MSQKFVNNGELYVYHKIQSHVANKLTTQFDFYLG